MLTIQVLGPLQVVRSDGVDLTPKGAKNQALIALLATGQDLQRPRRWVQDVLWSTFGPEQAGANLRQSLSRIRAALGEHMNVLLSDRERLGFDPDKVTVDFWETPGKLIDPDVFLPGLDARDPAFENWLVAERQELGRQYLRISPEGRRGVTFACSHGLAESEEEQIIGELMATRVATNLTEQVRGTIVSGQSDDASTPSVDFLIKTDFLPSDAGRSLFLKVVKQQDQKQVLSRLLKLSHPSEAVSPSQGVMGHVFEISDSLLGALPNELDHTRPEQRATAFFRLALYRMMTFETDAMREAEGLLLQAYDTGQNGVYLGWAALLCALRQEYSAAKQPLDFSEKAFDYLNRAADQRKESPLLDVMTGLVRLIFNQEIAAACELAVRATERNPCCALGWIVLARARAMGQETTALAAADRACAMTGGTPYETLALLVRCDVALQVRAFDQAMASAEAVLIRAPLNRPALLRLLFLYRHSGRHTKEARVSAVLNKIAPGMKPTDVLASEAGLVKLMLPLGGLDSLLV
jgi:DNA-binding SARP family transcriptional activator